MQRDPQGFDVARVALLGLASLLLAAVIYTLLAVGVFRRWGARALWAFWIVSAVILSALAVARSSTQYVAHGGRPVGWLWGSFLVAFVTLATAGACLRVAQSGRQPAQPSFARQTLAGCGGMLVAGGTLFLGLLLMDLRRLWQ
jgi:hypothetical protein